MAKNERDEDRAVQVLMSELREGSEKLAVSLFPKGPPGTQTLRREAELDLVARHWDDLKFRQNLLNRMAPPGPDGSPDPVLAQDFIKLYREAVLERGSVTQDVVDKVAEREPQGPATAPAPGGGLIVAAGTGDDGLSPASYRGERETPQATTPNVTAPPTADPTGPPAATPEVQLPSIPAGMAPPPALPPELA